MAAKHCSDCGKANSTVKDHQKTSSVGGSQVTAIYPLCDLCHRDRMQRKFLKRNSA